MRSISSAAILLLAARCVAGADEPVPASGLDDPTLTIAAPAPPPVESASRRHARAFHADPFLLTAGFGIGVEPSDRGSKQPSAFVLNGQALWRGLFGLGVGLYGVEGQAVLAGKDRENHVKPSLGDRVSVVLAVALRPLTFVAWQRGDDYLARFLAGISLELGGSFELVRTGLDQAIMPGFHALLSIDVPVWGAGSRAGVALRFSARLLVTGEAQLVPDGAGAPQIVEPGTVGQLFAGVAFYL